MLVKACKREEIVGDLEVILSLHKDDFDPDLLRLQLQTFGTHYLQTQGKSDNSSPTILDVKKLFFNCFSWTKTIIVRS